MIYGLYNSAAGMLTNEYRQAVIANNLANADTVGFKRDVAVFAERPAEALAGQRQGPSDPSLAELSGGLWLGQTHTSFGEGTRIATGNPLDIALDGPGFLSVQADGRRLYTRDGRMTVNRDGELVSVTDGAAYLGRGGAPIRLNPQGGQPSIDEHGRVLQDGRVVAELEVADFANYAGLQKAGENRLTAADSAAQSGAALVRSGYVEASSVEALSELVNMMDSTRAYQINAQMVSLQDQTVGRLITVISRA